MQQRTQKRMTRFFFLGILIVSPVLMPGCEQWFLRTVPDVTGQTLTVAEAALTEAGLTRGTVTLQCSNNVSSGNVIGQDPAAGTKIKENTPVNL